MLLKQEWFHLELQPEEAHANSEERSSQRGWPRTGRSNVVELEEDCLRSGWKVDGVREVF